MLEVMNKNRNTKLKNPKKEDVYVAKVEEIITYDEEGNEVKKRKTSYTNVTKLVNETKKLIKVNIAEQKIDEVKKILSK